VTVVINGFSIVAANGGRECRQEFVRIVDEPMAYGPAEGYEVMPHENDRDFLGWEKAVITRSE
jgi:hypothetical protein